MKVFRLSWNALLKWSKVFKSLISLFDNLFETGGFRKASTLKGQPNALLPAERMHKIAFSLLRAYQELA